MIEIPLSKQGKHRGKYVAIVDDEDAILAEINWCISDGYAARKGKPPIRMHRIIMERMISPLTLQKGQDVDHINGDTLDNRRENLRIATRAQNNANRGKNKNNKSGYRGVFYNAKLGKFMAQICIDRKRIHIGCFATAKEAYKAYCERFKEIHGDYAKIEDEEINNE